MAPHFNIRGPGAEQGRMLTTDGAMKMGTRIPADVFPPGEFIKDELEARGWSQLDLAEVLGRPPKFVSELLSAKRQITPQAAAELAGAFGTDPQFWMNLESAYQLSKTNQRNDSVEPHAD